MGIVVLRLNAVRVKNVGKTGVGQSRNAAMGFATMKKEKIVRIALAIADATEAIVVPRGLKMQT